MSEFEKKAYFNSWRILERLRYGVATQPAKKPSQFTFLVPHHNCARFLEICLHSIRRIYADSPIIIVDSGSSRREYIHAKNACKRFNADFRPYVFRHGHTGQLNRLLGLAETDKTVILDQDCILLDVVDELCELLEHGYLLIGPQDRMILSHPRLVSQAPVLHGTLLRNAGKYIHASFMLTRPKEVLTRYGSRPFSRNRDRRALDAPELVEPYYGLCEHLHEDKPDAILALDTIHTAYGLGMGYAYKGRLMAYHQWYSGRTHKLQGKIDKLLDVTWLDAERDRFIDDYWNNSVNFELSSNYPAAGREEIIVGDKAQADKRAIAVV